MPNYSDDERQQSGPAEDIFLPRQPINITDFVEERLVRLGRGQVKTVGTSTPGRTFSGIPRQVWGVLATESPSIQNDRVLSLVSVQFLRDPGDAAFQGVRVWFTGYQGNTAPVLMADGTDSPLSFLCESTDETVVVTIQAFGPGGAADFDSAPTCTVTLDGVTSAPPAPTIAQQLVGITGGLQFQFNMLSGLSADIIDGYWVYKHTADDSTAASRYKYVKHTPLNTGVYTFQDVVGGSQTFYYWVSAVNTSQLESTLTAAQSSATSSGGTGSTTTIYRPSAQSTSGTAYTNPSYAYDANTASAATAHATNSGGLSFQEQWTGFSAAAGSPTAVTLKIKSMLQAGDVPNGVSVTGRIRYSTNSGGAWTTVYNITDTGRADTTDSISLSTSQNLTTVYVDADCSTLSLIGDGHYVYEIWIEVVT